MCTLRAMFALAVAASFAPSVHAAPLSFHKDVEPILQHHCQSCHRPGESAPMSLLTYAQARPWAKAIRASVFTGKMPPWQADPHYGKFSNDPSLTAAEKQTLLSWVDTGSQEGNPADAPKPIDFPQGWRIPKPDIVFEMPQDFTVPARGALDYQYIAVPTHFTEDKWVEMAEVRPGDRSVVHHAIVVVDTGGGEATQEYLAGYAPGMNPQIWKPGQARRIKAGASLVFQMHYSPTGKLCKDRTRIGLVFAKAPVTEQIVARQVMYPALAIPPGNPNFRVEASVTIQDPVRLAGMRAHMHLRGKSFQFRAIYPTGESEILLNIPKFDFDWQPYYYLESPKLLPRGTKIICTAYYDNSANNINNPDPNKLIRWGPQSWDEMMIGWLDLAVPARP
ncbi:MAG TPA: thiol-disulfide isomerase [Bryobacteraceae bacterium]